MQLIIVESPTKAKTINKFLDKSYVTSSSFGHIRDLPEKELGIDIENNFKPKYAIPSKAKRVISDLKAKVKLANSIILATDEDREGEAIAWHLKEALKLEDSKIKRIVFHEITKEAILEALNSPRDINLDLVNAQQARRVLDRLVGYKLSPFLFKKVARGLSAGRVQSVAVRLIVEREREIKKFVSEEYWSILVNLKKQKEECQAELYKIEDKLIPKLSLTKDKAIEIEKNLEIADYIISKIEEKEVSKKPPLPFTTSSLQQTANRQLGYSAKQTMMIAQKLYEEGYITYMRTDSFNLANSFLTEAKNWLNSNLDSKYSLSKPRVFKQKKKNAQEAHEAIRPTKAFNTPDKISNKLDNSKLKLYTLIWQRTIASQMPEAKLISNSILIEARTSNNKNYTLKATGQRIVFDAYLKIYPEKTKEQFLPKWNINNKLELEKIKKEQHFTKGPARYSDAGLVKELEKNEIGRPSTYAPTISTIINRNYIKRDEAKRLYPTDIAYVVNDLLVKHFSKIVDYKFTAEMENDLDEIALGKKNWEPIIKNFYLPFAENLKIKDKELTKKDIIPEEESDEICDKCQSKMIIKTGRYGKFLACSNYPDCKNIKNIKKDVNPEEEKEINELNEKYKDKNCNKCNSKMLIKKGKFGLFLACSAFPKCKNIENLDDGPEINCPICSNGKIIKKMSKRGPFYACNNYPDCKNSYSIKPLNKNCKTCNNLMINKNNKEVCSDKKCSSHP